MISDVVETVTFEIGIWLKLRDRELIKNPETRDFQICAFCRIFFLNVITSKLNIFQTSGIFPTGFGCFLPANTKKQNLLNYRNFTKLFLCNIQML